MLTPPSWILLPRPAAAHQLPGSAFGLSLHAGGFAWRSPWPAGSRPPTPFESCAAGLLTGGRRSSARRPDLAPQVPAKLPAIGPLQTHIPADAGGQKPQVSGR